MNDFVITTEFILMMLPLAAIQLGLFIYSAVKIFKEGVQNLSKWAWFFICLLGSLLGSIIFLIVGRKRQA